MNVINPDEWQEFRRIHAEYPENTYSGPLLGILCLLDLARYGIRWGTPAPEWVRCVDMANGTRLTEGRVYRVLRRDHDAILVNADRGTAGWFNERRFVPATAAEATVTIDVPVAWARYMAANEKCSPAEFLAAVDACREALTKAGLL